MRMPAFDSWSALTRLAVRIPAAGSLLALLLVVPAESRAQQPPSQAAQPRQAAAEVTLDNVTLETVDQLPDPPLKQSLTLALRAEQTLIKVKDYSASLLQDPPRALQRVLLFPRSGGFQGQRGDLL